ncbi:Metal-dependent hydrolase [Chitinispirillum alkaliphilum]|nr:Metal-dependent hydrolase [Chitinispirillum alkaliphilum]
MGRLIDLSHKIENGMPVHCFDNKMNLYLDKTIKTHKYNNSRLEIGMHTGTHIDISSHLIRDNKTISEIDLNNFTGPGKIFDVRGKRTIKRCDFQEDIICSNDIIIFCTGHSSCYYQENYFTQYPIFETEVIDLLIEKKVKILGIDSPSPDRFPFEEHIKLFKNGILILENLTNLEKILNIKVFDIFVFPLKIHAEASLVRAIAKIY